MKAEVLNATEEFMNLPGYLDGYHWLMKKMDERIGMRPTKQSFPIWAWYQWNNAKYKKPNLLASAHYPPGTKCVRLEIEKEEKDILLSDFTLWHFPISYKSFIGKKADCIAFERRLQQQQLSDTDFAELPLNIQIEIVKSWDCIIDMEFADKYFTRTKENKAIQAIFWTLKLEEVKKVEFFTAR